MLHDGPKTGLQGIETCWDDHNTDWVDPETGCDGTETNCKGPEAC